MALIIRRNFQNMRDEFLLRMGKQNVTSWLDRGEHFITAAYYDLALLFHHYELEVVETTQAIADTDGLDLGALDSDLYALMGIRLIDGDGRHWPMTQKHSKFNFQEIALEPGRPQFYARRADLALFEKPSDKIYNYQVFYYKQPEAPDFDTTDSSELEWLWDEHIIQRAMFLAAPATWRYDMSQVQAQTLQDFLGQQPQATSKAGLVSRAEVPHTSQNAGGAQ